MSQQIAPGASSAQLQAELDAARDRVYELQQELAEARARERAGERQRRVLDGVLERMRGGEHVVNGATTTGPWWVNGTSLVERATPDEMQAIYTLGREGIVIAEQPTRDNNR